MGTAILFTSLQLWLTEPYHIVQWKLPTYSTAILFPADQVMCNWLNHTTWFQNELSTAPKHGIWVNVASFVLHNTVANMLYGLFDDCKYMDIYLPIPQEYCYLGKQKNSLYFLASACEHLWPSHSHVVNCTKCEQIPSKYVADWSVWKVV